jgi:hypothetical protein
MISGRSGISGISGLNPPSKGSYRKKNDIILSHEQKIRLHRQRSSSKNT